MAHSVEFEQVDRAAGRFGVPAWQLKALSSVESGSRHLAPTQDGGSLSYYPYGLKLVSAQTVLPDVDDDVLLKKLRTLEGNTEIGARLLKRGISKPWGDNDELVRVWWVRPRTASSMARGEPAPKWTARTLERWRAARREFRGQA